MAAPLTRLEVALREAAAVLAEAGHGWALVGGLAISALVEPRLTRDVDLVVGVESDEQAEQVVRRMVASGWGAVTSVEQDRTGRLATVRLRPPARLVEGVVVDLLFASSGIEPEIVASARPLDVFDDRPIPVASIGHLLATKLLARDDRRRPMDYDDIRGLLREARDQDIADARAALRLIEERGYARGRDLVAALDAFIGAGEVP